MILVSVFISRVVNLSKIVFSQSFSMLIVSVKPTWTKCPMWIETISPQMVCHTHVEMKQFWFTAVEVEWRLLKFTSLILLLWSYLRLTLMLQYPPESMFFQVSVMLSVGHTLGWHCQMRKFTEHLVWKQVFKRVLRIKTQSQTVFQIINDQIDPCRTPKLAVSMNSSGNLIIESNMEELNFLWVVERVWTSTASPGSLDWNLLVASPDPYSIFSSSAFCHLSSNLVNEELGKRLGEGGERNQGLVLFFLWFSPGPPLKVSVLS